MTRIVLATLAVLLAGCAIVSPRQTLLVLEDGTTAYAEGRKDVCLAAEDGDGVSIGEVCDITIDPLGMGVAAIFPLDGRLLLIAVLPLDVAEVRVQSPDAGVIEVLERIESDITTGFAVAELDPSLGSIELVGLDENGGLVDTSEPIQLRTDGVTSSDVG